MKFLQNFHEFQWKYFLLKNPYKFFKIKNDEHFSQGLIIFTIVILFTISIKTKKKKVENYLPYFSRFLRIPLISLKQNLNQQNLTYKIKMKIETFRFHSRFFHWGSAYTK